MIRTFNYTGRSRITRKMVQLELITSSSGPPTFEFELDAQELALPEDARVWVEAYHRQSYMRFDWGTVKEPSPPADTRLRDITGERVLFRVKIVEADPGTGRLLATADGLLPENVEEASDSPLLPVDVQPELDGVAWTVAFRDEAVLVLNGKVPAIKERIRNDPIFRALVFPTVLRDVLCRAFFVEGCTSGDDDGWAGQWIRFGSRLLGEEPPADGDAHDLMRWMDDTVQEFGRRLSLVDDLVEAVGG